jgi:hypothetical protein
VTTLEHLEQWLEHEFPDPEDRERVRGLMLALYDNDPEYWAGVGWRRLYNAVIDNSVTGGM